MLEQGTERVPCAWRRQCSNGSDGEVKLRKAEPPLVRRAVRGTPA
jgi:hypothetical protein